MCKTEHPNLLNGMCDVDPYTVPNKMKINGHKQNLQQHLVMKGQREREKKRIDYHISVIYCIFLLIK